MHLECDVVGILDRLLQPGGHGILFEIRPPQCCTMFRELLEGLMHALQSLGETAAAVRHATERHGIAASWADRTTDARRAEDMGKLAAAVAATPPWVCGGA